MNATLWPDMYDVEVNLFRFCQVSTPSDGHLTRHHLPPWSKVAFPAQGQSTDDTDDDELELPLKLSTSPQN